MDYETAEIKIRECKTKTGVYGVLEDFGVTVSCSYSLHKRLKECRDAYQYKSCEVILVALTRLKKIDNNEV